MKRVPHLLLLFAILGFSIGCSQVLAVQRGSANNRYKGASNSAGSQQTPDASLITKLLGGKVVGIADGDTFTVLDNKDIPRVVRMKGIDAPEKQQPFSSDSRRNLERLIAGKSVIIDWQKYDQHGRIVGKVLFNGDDICLEQIKAGLAWHYKFEGEQSNSDRRLYSDAEQEARTQGLGLWQERDQIPPWVFRHDRGFTVLPRENKTLQQPLVIPTVEAIRGNRRSKIYHWPGCPNYDDIAPHNRVPFRSREEAEQAGYRAARNCF